MKLFLNLSVKKKLISVFSVVCIFMVVIGVEGILSSSKINAGSEYIYTSNVASISSLKEIKININEISSNMLRIVFERDKSKLDEQIKAIDDLTNKNKKLQEEYESIPDELNADIAKEETETYEAFKNDLAKYREKRNNVIGLAKTNNYEE